MRLFQKIGRANTKTTSKDAVNDEPPSIGSVLLRMRKVTPEQLRLAASVQARTNEHMLGALLIESGAVSALDVAKALEIQAKIKAGDRATAELDMLDAVMAESVECNRALDEAIARRKEKARESGSHTFLQLVPKVA